jgi:hypothetical protein
MHLATRLENEFTFKVGHVSPYIRVQSIDDHLAVSRSGDLDSPVDQTGSWRRSSPGVILANVLCFWEEVEQVALVELGLSGHSPLQQVLTALVKCAVQESEEDGGILAENVPVLVIELAEDIDLAEDGVGISCHCRGESYATSIVGNRRGE